MIAYLYIVAISLGMLSVMSRLLPSQLASLIGAREFAAAIYLPTVATFSPHFLIFCLLVIAFMAAVPAKPEERLRLLIFCLPLLPSLSYVLVVPVQLIAVNYNMMLYFGVIGLLFAVRPMRKFRFGIYDIGIVLLITSIVWGGAQGSSFTNFLRYTTQIILGVGLPYLILSRGLAAASAPRNLVIALIFAAAILAAITVFESQRSWLLYNEISNGFGLPEEISAYSKQRGGMLRASATFPEPTSLSLFLGLMTVMLVALRRQFESRPLFYLLLAVLILGQVFALARIGPVVTVVGLVAMFFYERRYGLLALGAVAAPVLWVMVIFVATYVPVLAALLGLTEDSTGTVDYRELLADRMMEEIALDPWFGLTKEEVDIRLADMRQGEGIIDLVNTPLAVLLRSGVFGFVLYLVPSVVSLVALIRIRRVRKDADLAAVCTAVFATLVALHAGLVTTALSGRNGLWLILLLAFAAGLVARVRQASRARVAAAAQQHPALAARTPALPEQAPAA